MTHPTKTTRAYRSELRARQEEATRAAILDAALRVMADGFASLSIPVVARAAGVSISTIYRHFPTKEILLSSLYPHIVRRAGLHELVPPRTIDEVRESVRAYVGRLDTFDDLTRAAMASPSSEEARRLTMPARMEMGRRLADSVRPKLDPMDREHCARTWAIYGLSGSLRLLRDHLGLSVDEVADHVDWVMRAVVGAADTRSDT